MGKKLDLGPESLRIKLCRVVPRGQWKCRAGETEEDFPRLCEDEMTELLSQKLSNLRASFPGRSGGRATKRKGSLRA